LAMFLRHIHGALNLQEAIEAPAWMSHHAPSSFYPRDAEPGLLEIEGRFSEATLDVLRRRGHRLSVAPDWSLGRLGAVGRTDDGQLMAAANPRNMQGYAVGR